MTRILARSERSLISRIGWFALAGIAGFAVDASVLTLLVHLGTGPYAARLVSFAFALVTTWLLNRSLAFGDRASRPSLAEFLQYAGASSFAALVNLGVYTVLVTQGAIFAANPVLAAALATGVSMSVNFLSYLKIVFAGRSP
jgi:putative flippase GtrA